MGALVVEHKTTSLEIGPGSPYWRRLLLDSQISTYLTGARALGHEPDGVLYDVVRKVALRPQRATPVESRKYTKDGRLYAAQRESDETPDEYRERVRAAIAAAPEAHYQRGTVVRLEREVADAARDMWELGRQIRESQLAHRWPRNPDACDSYGQICPYFDVCTGVATIDDRARFRHVAPSGDADKRRLPVLSTSAAKSYRSCPRKYYFAYELRARPTSDADALRFGTLFHIGLETWWKTVDVDAAVGAMAARYRDLEVDPYDIVRAEELLRGYHARWSGESLEVLGVEAEFSAPLVNPDSGAASKTWTLGGRIDAIARVVAPELEKVG